MSGTAPRKYQQRRPERTVLYGIIKEHLESFLTQAHESSGTRLTKGLGAQYLRFNLHAGVSIPGGLPAARERLLRYCARPPLALERLSVLDDGRICYRIKDTEQVRLMTPMQFMARLAALVPPPRHPLVRYYGAWAPHSQCRSRVVPVAPHETRPACTEPHALPPLPFPPAERVSVAVTRSETASPHHDNADPSTSEPSFASSRPVTSSLAAMPKAASAPLAPSREVADELRFARLSRLAWATLYQRVFDIDPLECSRCGGRMRFVQVIEDVTRARSELRRRNLPAEPPPLSRARSPDCGD